MRTPEEIAAHFAQWGGRVPDDVMERLRWLKDHPEFHRKRDRTNGPIVRIHNGFTLLFPTSKRRRRGG